jgi:hypothetical protein
MAAANMDQRAIVMVVLGLPDKSNN